MFVSGRRTDYVGDGPGSGNLAGLFDRFFPNRERSEAGVLLRRFFEWLKRLDYDFTGRVQSRTPRGAEPKSGVENFP